MSQQRAPCRNRAVRGFTLIETILVMVVMGIAAATIAVMSSKIFDSQTINQDMQIGLKLMQECAEHVLAERRATASFSTFTPDCTALPNLSADLTGRGFSKPTAASADLNAAPCPTGTCKQVTVTVAIPGASNLNPITILLVP